MALASNFQALSLANHDFSTSLYTELAKTETGNMLYSPFSIHLIMFMASVGAVSTTFDEMISTIHLNKSTHSLESYKNLLEELTGENDKLRLATGMFVSTNFKVNPKFVNNSKTYLKSSLEQLNFQNEPELQRQYINNWVSKKTENKIKDLFPKDSINKGTSLVLANAVHFKSTWDDKFTETKDEPFYLNSKDQITVKMMTLIHDMQYYHDDGLKFAAIELPYENFFFKMIILLPDAKDGLKNLENNLSKIKLYEISNKMSKFHATVKLPRFKIEQSLNLKETLTKLGCPTMFTEKANFSNINENGGLYVSNVVHKAYINLNENGTEAAAATGLTFSFTSMPMPAPPVNYFADHPFIFAITSRNDDVLFMGRLTKP